MSGEGSVPMGTTGIVTRVVRDPFEDGGKIIDVKWDNGSSLSLVSVDDSWIKVDDSNDPGIAYVDYFLKQYNISFASVYCSNVFRS